jgi:integrase
MAEDRVPMAEIAAYLGHKDLNITVRTYARFAPDYLREAAKSLDW